MQKLQIISVMLSICTAIGLGACDNSATKSELHAQVGGIYGVSADCVPVTRGKEPPKGKSKPTLSVFDNYEIDDRICTLEKIAKDGDGFILKSQTCRTNLEKVSDDRWVSDVAEPFELRVQAIDKNTVIFQETGKTPITVYRCGSNAHSKVPKPPRLPSKRD